MPNPPLEPRVRVLEVDVAVIKTENENVKEKLSGLEDWRKGLSEQWVKVVIALGSAGIGALAAFIKSVHK